ncbi:RHS repeat-associated core domain-containing protein [Serratia sp. DD3]|uniref:RHS repeat-associated core domain-containing protein n=1 Tax=Serratia sp. DD3 TaxID=1410619 RepID=UPI0004D7E3FF|nr:RHS repeat-associated core domain-containing protein [Serratia sp. DD3]KEY58177.1 putative deoxyribonuclease RhsC [Serratia sp. DD3]
MAHASSHFDPQLGIDLHFYLTTPVPVPTPHIGLVFDVIDYLPIIGGSIDVNGRRRTTAGTGGKCLHIPVAGAWLPPQGFPMGPMGDDELFMGSQTVSADGDPFSRIGVPALSCNVVGMFPPFRVRKPFKIKPKSLEMPLTFNIAIPNNVIVGGPLTVNWVALGVKAFFKGFKRFKKSNLYKKGMDKFKAVRKKLFKNMDSGFWKCQVFRAEPVDIRDGSVYVQHQDFSLPGRFPLAWTRVYRSSDEEALGVCGLGWQTPADTTLSWHADEGVGFFRSAEGLSVFAELPVLPGETQAVPVFPAGRLWYTEHHGGTVTWTVSDDDEVRHHFTTPSTFAASRQEYPISTLGDGAGNGWQFIRDQGELVCIREVTHRGPTGREIHAETAQGRLHALAFLDPHDKRYRPLTQYDYDDTGYLTKEIDAEGCPRHYRYRQGAMTAHTDRLGLSFYYDYDEQGRVVHAWGDQGLYDYRFVWHDLLNEVEVTDSLGHTSRVRFSSDGLPVSETDPQGHITTFQYNETGLPVQVSLSSGAAWRWEYDDCGQITAEIAPSGHRDTFVRDPAGRLTHRTDGEGAVWQYEYDGHGNLLKATDPTGLEKHYRYDDYGQLTESHTADLPGSQARYDAFGFVRSFASPGVTPQLFEHDGMGNLITATDSNGVVTRSFHDRKNRLVAQQRQGGMALRISWDREDQPVLYQDDSGRETRLEYSGTGMLSRCVTPDGHEVRYHYDTEEQLVGVSNPVGQRWTLVRNALGLIVEEQDYWGQSTHYAYSSDGLLTRRTDPLGQVLRYRYNQDGALTEKLPETGDIPLTLYRYDRRGRLTQCDNAHRKLSWEYDAAGRVLAEIQDGFRLEHRYNALGQYLQRASSAGHQVSWGYNALGQPVQLQLNQDEPVTLGWDACGRLARQGLSDSLVKEFHYDAHHRLTSQTLMHGEHTLFNTQYRWDREGNITERQDSLDGSSHFTYDPMGKLLAATQPDGHVLHFITDAAGNHMATTVRAVSEAPGGWFREGRRGTTRYVYDRAGNLRQRRNLTLPASRQDLVWDVENQLIQVHQQDTVTHYGYDGLGRRVTKQGPEESQVFFWQGNHLIAEARAETPLPESASVYDLQAPQQRKQQIKRLLPAVREYVYLPGSYQPLALMTEETADRVSYWYECDPNGAPIRLLDVQGRLVWHQQHGVWGEPGPQRANTVENPLRFQGQYYDKESGLHYNRYRYYDPQTAAFISQDPIGLAGGLNLYAYVPNPLTWIDPLGLSSCAVTRAAEHRSNFGGKPGGIGKGRNIATSNYDIDGVSGVADAVSGRGSIPGFVDIPDPSNRLFTTTTVSHPRDFDSEAKILEHIGSEITTDSKGTINIFSELPICDSCQGVIRQFGDMFPGVKINILQ